ncbi:MAG: hypothetical protein SGPRY_004639 [Prymnesium sp.]
MSSTMGSTMQAEAQRAAPATTHNVARAPQQVKGQPRVNWSQGEALEKLRTAVENWLSKSGELLSVDIVQGVGIPEATLGHYLHPDVSKRGLMQANLAWWMETPNNSWLLSSDDAIAETMVLVATKLWIICFKT